MLLGCFLGVGFSMQEGCSKINFIYSFDTAATVDFMIVASAKKFIHFKQ
jgi:hypothetical protein